MKNLRFKITAILLLLFSFIINAQEFQGKATYFSKTTLDIDFSTSGIPADRVKMIKERMKSNLERTYEFTFDKTASIYKLEETLDQSPTGGGGGGRGMQMMLMAGGGTSGKYYKNIQTRVTATENEFSGKFFLIKDSLKVFTWKMEKETKMIGNYLCFKATTTVERPAKPEIKFGPRNNTPEQRAEEEKKAKELENVVEVVPVTAWYTLDIPISNGPGDYWGLPGLILEISEGNTQVLCTKIVLNSKEKVEIVEPKKGKEISQKEYDQMVIEKNKEMRERMQNERQKSGGGGPPGRMN
jgi:GLPGLI family protein